MPAAGFWLMTLPDATVLLDCCVTPPTVRPAPVMALVAAACVMPATFGTAMLVGALQRANVENVPVLSLTR